MDLLKLPKAELHCHLDGSVRPETLHDLGREKKLTWAAGSVRDVEKALRAGEPKLSLEDYLQTFAFTLSVLRDAAVIERVAKELAEDAKTENIIHLETRFSPMIFDGVKPEAAIEAALAGLKDGVILCGIRDHAPEETERVVELAIKYAKDGVAGVDLAGPEKGHPAQRHRKAFDKAKAAGLGITIHAGEAEGAWAVKDAIENEHATRIGHGTHAIEDESVIEMLVEKKIVLEVCLTSNLETQSISTIAGHPLQKLRAKGVRVTLCTDNRLMSKVRLTDEFERAEKAFALSDQALQAIARTGVEAAFVSAERRAALLTAFDSAKDCFPRGSALPFPHDE